jgi:hypothetical protein
MIYNFIVEDNKKKVMAKHPFPKISEINPKFWINPFFGKHCEQKRDC